MFTLPPSWAASEILHCYGVTVNCMLLGIRDVTQAKQRGKSLLCRAHDVNQGLKVTRDHDRGEGGNC